MRNVLNFLLRYNSWLLLALYIVVSCMLLFNFNDFQQSVWLTSTNRVSASLNSVYGEATSYMSLRQTNATLEERNAALSEQVMRLKEELQKVREMLPDSTFNIPGKDRFSYITASVISSSQGHARNYLTINKGSSDGIRPGMGVICSTGVVGIIDVCAPHVSRVISVLNTNQRFSVKLAGTEYIGSLHWIPGDPEVTYMEEVPRHARFFKDMLVVTSGFSTAFPEGIPVGRVTGSLKNTTDNYLTLKLRLLPDFRRLQTLWVINDIYRNELDSVSIQKAQMKPTKP